MEFFSLECNLDTRRSQGSDETEAVLLLFAEGMRLLEGGGEVDKKSAEISAG
jgi:hypothetical protein